MKAIPILKFASPKEKQDQISEDSKLSTG